MKPFYTEQDLVLKHDEIEGLLRSVQTYGILTPEQRSTLIRLLEETKRTGEILPFPDLTAEVSIDPSTAEFLLVIHDVYDPQNLVSILFDRLTTIEEGDLESEKANANILIESYLGMIEKKEKVNLSEIKQKLTQLTLQMKETISLFIGDEFSEQDYEKLSDSLEKAYFGPLSELLEGVLVTIAGS